MIHFITYGDGPFENARKRIVEEAKNTNWFDTISSYTRETLSEKFRQDYSHVLRQTRGGGYWIWKFDVLQQKMDEIPDGEIIVYLDSGCTINPRGKERFREYINMLNDSEEGIISFELNELEEEYTTKQLLEHFDCGENKPFQYMATVLMMKKANHVQDILNMCFDVIQTDWRLITDFYNKTTEQSTQFKDNRHDQSILSLARKKKGSLVLSDETWADDFKKLKNFPFWATRKKK